MSATEGPRILRLESVPHEDGCVLISVADTGAGVSSRDADRIFSPLYTSKADGMGMGLSICRAIVEAHAGRLWFSENTPRGAVFHFTLQAAASG
jgi:signal transduction histidine kinase